MNIEITNLTNSKADEGFFQKIGEKVLRKLKFDKNTEISLVFVGEKRMRELNKKYRGKDKVTDVLSFAYSDIKIPPSPPFIKGGVRFPPFPKEGQGGFWGEIVICVPQARRQSAQGGSHGGQAKRQTRRQSYPLERELTMLFIHGILHLAGYDDEKQEDYERMMRKQEEVLSFLKFVTGN